MKKIFNLLLCFFPFITLQAQINELGVFIGGSNFVGDVGSTTYINPDKPAIGILYKWNRSPRLFSSFLIVVNSGHKKSFQR